MAKNRAEGPSDDELIAFAVDLIGESGARSVDRESIEIAVTEAREIWLVLYQINRLDATS